MNPQARRTAGALLAAGAAIEPALAQAPELLDPGAPLGLSQLLWSMLSNNLYPNLPGALMLLVLSLLFSTLNFYSELPEKQQSFRRTYRYLILWVSFNYIFALIFLLLILPDGVKMNVIGKDLFVYCLIATALPELSANLRLQLGHSRRQSLDLHKYKIKMSELISQRMERLAWEESHRDIGYLEACFGGRQPEFQARVEAFVANSSLSDEERADLAAICEALKAQSPQQRSLSAVLAAYPGLTGRLLDWFHEDIEHFESSTVARMMRRMHPMLSVDEARKLVSGGITSPRRFLLHTLLAGQRRRLAQRSGIDEERISLIHYETRAQRRRRFWARVRWSFALLLLMGLIVNLVNWHAGREHVSYAPATGALPEAMALPDSFDPAVTSGKVLRGQVVAPAAEAGVER